MPKVTVKQIHNLLKEEMTTAKDIIESMESLHDEEQRRVLMGFFKTGKGEYGIMSHKQGNPQLLFHRRRERPWQPPA